MNTIIGITPTFLLKRVKYETVVDNYNAKKYTVMPEFETTNNKYTGTLIYENDKVIGFKTTNDKLTLVLLYAKPKVGICAHCEMDTINICAFGIPEKMVKTENQITIYTKAETCSLECSLSCVKKFGRMDLNLDPKYMDVNSMIRALFVLYFPTISELNEAPAITELTKFEGPLTPAAFRSKLHFYHYKEEQLGNTPKVILNLK